VNKEVFLTYWGDSDFANRRSKLLEKWGLECSYGLFAKGRIGPVRPLQDYILVIVDQKINHKLSNLPVTRSLIQESCWMGIWHHSYNRHYIAMPYGLFEQQL